jgi:hypothetical protein
MKVFIWIIIAVILIFILLYYQYRKNIRKVAGSDANLITIDPAPFLDKARETQAKIVSVHPREASGTDPREKIVRLRLAVKDDDGNYVVHTVKWKIVNFVLADFRQGKMINVKVYDDYVFPEIEGAVLVSESTS